MRVTDTFDILVSGAYQKQEQQIDTYRRANGSFEYAYRGSQIAGVTPPTFGFARPSNQGSGLTFGSDPAVYPLITPTTIIPALPSIGRQSLQYERIGATATAQWQPSDRTDITLDGVFSRYGQDSDSTSITTIGLNRNGTNARVLQTGASGLRPAGTTNGFADRVALYPNCVPSAAIDCNGEAQGSGVGAAPLAGYFNSLNPNNLNPFDYYNNPLSPGYVPTANQTGYHAELIGRPNTKIRAASVNSAGQADYLALDDVNWRSSTDSQFGRTDFKQVTLNMRQELSDRFQFEGTLGWSKSQFRSTGLLAEFNAMDRDGYVYDERDGTRMPVFNPGFDVADPNNWSLVKGLSTIRYFTQQIDSKFRVARANFTYEILPEIALKFGGTYKEFAYAADQGRRNQGIEAINPTLPEAGLQISDLGRTVGFGPGLEVSEGTPSSYYTPDLAKMIDAFGINCNCVNKWGDYRASVDGRQRNAVSERDASGYLQVDYDLSLFGGPLRGNIGMRVANTRIEGSGNIGGSDGIAGLPVTARNEYWDWLPSMNANWEVADGFIVRFAAAKVISRPQLGSLTPGTTSFSNALATSGAAPSLTVGNPNLNPFRATNFDLSFERYFNNNGLIGVALFSKKLNSFPQQIAAEAPLSSVFEPAVYDQIVASMTNEPLRAYTQAGGVWGVRQFQDALGRTIRGVEVNVQSDFFFLPAPFDRMGVTANYTHIDSHLSYLTGTVLATTQAGGSTAQNSYADGPFLNTSPNSFNATLYYEDELFSARVSGAYRTRYVNRFPLASGTCSVGTTTNAGDPCNSLVIGDFLYNEDQFNVDFAIGLNVTEWARLTLEGRNMTNTPQYRARKADNARSARRPAARGGVPQSQAGRLLDHGGTAVRMRPDRRDGAWRCQRTGDPHHQSRRPARLARWRGDTMGQGEAVQLPWLWRA